MFMGVIRQLRKKPQKDATALRSNVVDLGSYRQKRENQLKPSVYYLTKESEWSEMLGQIRSLAIVPLDSPTRLEALQTQTPPDLILIESWFGWANLYQMIQSLGDKHRVPIVMIWRGPSDDSKAREAVKKAYAAGISDILYAPLRIDDVRETLDVLLKFQQTQSLYH